MCGPSHSSRVTRMNTPRLSHTHGVNRADALDAARTAPWMPPPSPRERTCSSPCHRALRARRLLVHRLSHRLAHRLCRRHGRSSSQTLRPVCEHSCGTKRVGALSTTPSVHTTASASFTASVARHAVRRGAGRGEAASTHRPWCTCSATCGGHSVEQSQCDLSTEAAGAFVAPLTHSTPRRRAPEETSDEHSTP
jgi:hypothetical protein